MTQALYIMVGGFLGAGKSTALARLAEHLTAAGQRVGLITNDQGAGLVDTQSLRSRGFSVEEIAGGCFCCRFNSLVTAAESLTATTRPDVFLAEPVGSCTDLVASVSYPLRRIYGSDYRIAPLSVLVDPIRALRVLGLTEGRRFSSKVQYIYEKQLEEAEVLVINKCDLLDDETRHQIQGALQERYPNAQLFEVSARDGAGLDAWFEHVTTTEMAAGSAMEVDYRLYGEGEALLGWVNSTLRVSSTKDFDGNELIAHLMDGVQKRLPDVVTDVAHLKMTLAPDDGLGDIAVMNLVRQDYVPELSQTLADPLRSGELIVNLRAEAPPDALRAALEAALAASARSQDVEIKVEHMESFQPGQPTPTHRMVSSDAPEGERGDGTRVDPT